MISFIVPAHNEEALLGPTLDALHVSAQTLNFLFEIIVVNDGSTDQTTAIAARHGAKVLNVNVRQISAARNAGAKAARGDLFVFVDADTLVTPTVIAAAVQAMNGGAVGGGALVQWDGAMPWWADALATLTIKTMRMANFAAGCFVFCTRSAFEAVGGFDEGIYATEEIWLSRALGRLGRFVILPAHVTTSGRKLRTYSGFEIVRMTIPLLFRGFGVFRDRRHLQMWYGERRRERGEGP